VRFVGPRSGWSRFADLERADALFRRVIVERWNGAAVLRLVVLRRRVSERALCVGSEDIGRRRYACPRVGVLGHPARGDRWKRAGRVRNYGILSAELL